MFSACFFFSSSSSSTKHFQATRQITVRNNIPFGVITLKQRMTTTMSRSQPVRQPRSIQCIPHSIRSTRACYKNLQSPISITNERDYRV